MWKMINLWCISKFLSLLDKWQGIWYDLIVRNHRTSTTMKSSSVWKSFSFIYARLYKIKKPAFKECRHGADWEIWTLAPVSRPTPLAGEPLHHLGKSANQRARNSPIKKLAERVGFEPTWPLSQTVFKTASLWPLRYLSILNFLVLINSAFILYHGEGELSRKNKK